MCRRRRSGQWTALTIMVSLAASLAWTPSAGAYDSQNWDGNIREAFWFTSQGSQLIPYDWFRFLEQEGNETPFAADEHMNALRYIPAPRSARNPGGLPVGFARDWDTGRVGFTCAACHTGQIDYKGTSFVVDGAPAMANFDRFFDELVSALKATASDAAKFDRFARKVLGEGASATQRAQLREQLKNETAPLEARRDANWLLAGDPSRYSGFGRLDAFGQIYNQITALDLDVPTNARKPNAPASYPSLWGAPWSNVVQWNGSANNRLAAGPIVLGPILRNTVEVMGVFGQVELSRGDSLTGYDSKIDLDGLGRLEGYLCTLGAPRWPAELFGQPRPDLVREGRTIYASRCSGCHGFEVQIDRPYATPLVGLNEIGTDRTYATNTHDRTADTGWQEGRPENLIRFPAFGDSPYAWEVLQNATFGVMTKRFVAVPEAIRLGRCGGDDKSELRWDDQVLRVALDKVANRSKSTGDINLQTMPLGYRARPLNGVWATAPYLHNGSVPNLTELLKPPEERVKVFSVGSREYDPVNVGFVSTPGPDTTELDTTAADVGNSNLGHPFANGLGESERAALREYLKTL